MYGSFPIHAYTNVIESTQFRNCSSVCDTLVGFMFCCPEKYPLYTADIATNSIAGDRTFITYATSGTFKIFVAIKSAPKNNPMDRTNPIVVKNLNATLNILCAPFVSPIASLSDTSLDITLGIPIDESVSNNAYI